MTPYMSYVLQPSVELLTVEELETDERISLWICVIHTLTKTFEADEGGTYHVTWLFSLTPDFLTPRILAG